MATDISAVGDGAVGHLEVIPDEGDTRLVIDAAGGIRFLLEADAVSVM